MGAKMTPITKKRGRTVLGVRMGLARPCQTHEPDAGTMGVEARTAMLSIAAAGRRYLSHMHLVSDFTTRSPCAERVPSLPDDGRLILAGLLLLVFLGAS